MMCRLRPPKKKKLSSDVSESPHINETNLQEWDPSKVLQDCVPDPTLAQAVFEKLEIASAIMDDFEPRNHSP